MKSRVGIIMGSQTDAKIMSDAAVVLKEFKVPFEFKVISAHRTPELMQEYALEAEGRGLKVIIAGAGGAAHLPGMVAALTTLPVIGVPIALKELKGMDSLLSIAQMPKGVPVATVAINNAHNAGLLAVKMLALNDSNLTQKLHKHRQGLKTKVKLMQSALKKMLKR